MALLEPWRSRYLEALGVEQWVARAPLPNAAPSLPPVWDETAGQTVATDAPASAPQLNETADAVVAVERRPSPLPEISSDVARSSPPPTPPPPNRTQAPRERVRFSLLVVRLASDLLIVDAAAGQHELAEYLRLAAQVGRALGADGSVPDHDVFRWPIAHHPRVATDGAAAMEALTGCLIQQLQEGERQRLLLLGDEAARWVTTTVQQALPPCKLLSGPSLWRCLERGEAKRALWQALLEAGFVGRH